MRRVTMKRITMKRVAMKRAAPLFLMFGLAAVNAVPVQGQAALLVLLFGDKVASENFYFSLKIGANVSNLSGMSDLSARRGLNFGLLSTIKLNDDFYLVPEFSPISRKGAEGIPYPGSGLPPVDGAISPPDESTMNLNYLDLPVIAKYQINERLSIGTGPAFSFLLGASNDFTREFREEDVLTYSESSRMEWNRFDFGWAAEVTFSLVDAREGDGLNIHARYTKGFTDIISNNPGPAITNSTFQFFLSLPFLEKPGDDGT
jgi:Outer membrane protein beta-barrel domain